ncbi:hypothetical protein COCON_G00100990 [Conger conger]|uniref:VPS37 C-terminal domain-containing protein n=1 Tax=Conger conger TaxID=82655 RepID=A0A9Q1DHQ7_CONCO|nr:hypothetical protein COCON_G00100990 [Conger conger]
MSCGEKLMEKIQDLSQSELQDLLDDAGKVESLVQESDEVQTAQLDREMTLASNRSLAEQNLTLKPRLESQRDQLVERYSQLEGVRETYRQHCTQRDGIMGQVAPEGCCPGCRQQALAEQFLDGSLSLDSFLEHFLSLRSLAHRRRVRIEKLQDALRHKGGADAATSPPAAAAAPSPAAASPWQQPHHHHQPRADQPQSADAPPDHGGFPSASPSAAGHPLPYTPYPVSPQPSARGLGLRPRQSQAPFQPYPGQGFTWPPASRSGPRLLGPRGVQPRRLPLPHPARLPRPAPLTVPALQLAQRPYPSPHPFPGYNYPLAPGCPLSTPSGRPLYRPGFGVPQSYS